MLQPPTVTWPLPTLTTSKRPNGLWATTIVRHFAVATGPVPTFATVRQIAWLPSFAGTGSTVLKPCWAPSIG